MTFLRHLFLPLLIMAFYTHSFFILRSVVAIFLVFELSLHISYFSVRSQ